MSIFENVSESLGTVLEKAKDVPVETIAAVGLTLIGVAAIAARKTGESASQVIDVVKDVVDR